MSIGCLRQRNHPYLCCALALYCLLLLCYRPAHSQATGPQLNFTTVAITLQAAQTPCKVPTQPYPVVEATISSTHQAMRNGSLTCSQLVSSYVERMQQYEAVYRLNAIRVIAPTWQDDAAILDRQLLQIRNGSEAMPKLFCVPILAKDNIDVTGMATTNGAVGLRDNFPSQDSFQINLLKKAGAIILAKTNMAEWAFIPEISMGSLFGVVRNPYDLDRSTAGSSGGTAAGVSANFGLAGLGTDTGNSIRGPAGWTSVVGIRASLGLTSRSGVIPLDSTSDVMGPIARTVEDAVRLLEVTVAVDRNDNLTTVQSNYAVPSNYTQFLKKDGLQGMTVGILRQVFDPKLADPNVLKLFESAINDLSNAGATIVDNFTITGNSLGALPWNGEDTWYTGYGSSGKYEQLDCGARFKTDINSYLANATASFKTVQAVVAAGLIHPSANFSMQQRLSIPYLPSQYPPLALQNQGYVCNCDQYYSNPCRSEFRKRLIMSMDAKNVDVLVFPTWSNLPILIGDPGAPNGNNSPQLAPPTGAPAMAVPMGFAQPNSYNAPLPASITFLARPFDEGNMIKAAYSYEQIGPLRRVSNLFPECAGSSLSPAPGPTSMLAQAPNEAMYSRASSPIATQSFSLG